MADDIREKIIKNIQTSLEAINGLGNYSNTFVAGSIQRFKQSGVIATTIPFILLHEGPVECEPGVYPLTDKRLTIFLTVVTRHDETADSRYSEEIMNSLRADIERAMMADTRRGENAIDTNIKRLGEIEIQEGEPEIAAEMEFEIHYRTLRTDPGTIV